MSFTVAVDIDEKDTELETINFTFTYEDDIVEYSWNFHGDDGAYDAKWKDFVDALKNDGKACFYHKNKDDEEPIYTIDGYTYFETKTEKNNSSFKIPNNVCLSAFKKAHRKMKNHLTRLESPKISTKELYKKN